MKYLLSVAALAGLSSSIGFPESELAQISAECHNDGCCGCWSSCCHNHCDCDCDGHDHDDGGAGGIGGVDDEIGGPPNAACPPLNCPSLEDDGSVSALITIAGWPDQGFGIFGGDPNNCMVFCDFAEMWECMKDWGPFGWSGPGSELSATALWDLYNTNGDNCMTLDEF